VNAPFTSVPIEDTDSSPPDVVFFPDVASGLHVMLNSSFSSLSDMQLLSCALFVARDNFISTFYGMLFEQSKTDPANFT
jgi:hypothetical protein